MKNFLSALRAGLVIAACGASAAPHAALMTYTNRAEFDAATTLRNVEPFQAEPGSFYFLGTGIPYNGITFPPFAYFVDPAYRPALYEWGSGPVLLLDNEATLLFDPVTAFAADFGTLPDGVTLTVTIDGIATVIPTPAQRQLTFYGWTSSTPFSSVTFSSAGEYLILDNLTRAITVVGPPPPTDVNEPASLALAAFGMLALGARRRRAR